MELHWGPNCQLYVTPVGPEEVCVALISRDPALRLDAALRAFPPVEERLAVEALCDRVGILREGRLVEMVLVHQMRHLSALSVEATVDGPVPDLSAVPGVSAVEVTGQALRCHVRGPIEPLLKVLAVANVTQLLSREPSLEELFLGPVRTQTARPERGTPRCRLNGAVPGTR